MLMFFFVVLKYNRNHKESYIPRKENFMLFATTLLSAYLDAILMTKYLNVKYLQVEQK